METVRNGDREIGFWLAHDRDAYLGAVEHMNKAVRKKIPAMLEKETS